MQESKQWSQAVCCKKKTGKTTARDFQTPPNQQMYIYIFCRKPIDLKDVGHVQKMAVVFSGRCYLQSLASWMTGHEVGDFLPRGNGPEYFFFGSFNGQKNTSRKSTVSGWNHVLIPIINTFWIPFGIFFLLKHFFRSAAGQRILHLSSPQTLVQKSCKSRDLGEIPFAEDEINEIPLLSVGTRGHPKKCSCLRIFWCKFNQNLCSMLCAPKIWGRPVCRFFRRRSGCRDGFLAQCCNPFEMGCFFRQFFFGTKVLLASIVSWPSFLHLFWHLFPFGFLVPYLGSRPYVRSIDWPVPKVMRVFSRSRRWTILAFPCGRLGCFFGSTNEVGPYHSLLNYWYKWPYKSVPGVLSP